MSVRESSLDSVTEIRKKSRFYGSFFSLFSYLVRVCVINNENVEVFPREDLLRLKTKKRKMEKSKLHIFFSLFILSSPP